MPSKKLSLLIVEDEALELKRLERSFRRSEVPCEILTAVDRESAVMQYARAMPAVVILDLSLNGEGPAFGLDLISNFSRLNPAAQIVVLTGHTDPEIALDAIRRGASFFLNKPAEFSNLHGLVIEALKQAGGSPPPPPAVSTLSAAVERVERDLIAESLRRNANVLTAVCQELGIGRTTLWRKIRQYRLTLRD